MNEIEFRFGFRVACLCACTLFSLAAAGDGDVNGWKNGAGSGLWSVADNWWQGHLPTVSETLFITNAVEDGLTVTLDGDYLSTATNVLTVANSTGATNVLRVTGSLTVARAEGTGKYSDITVGKGGRLELVDGGELVRRNGNYGQYNSTDGWKHYFIGLTGGGEFRQTGGLLTITNKSMQGILVGDSTGNVTSRYVMTGGSFVWAPDVVSYASLKILKYGRVEIGGDACIDFFHDNEYYRADEFSLRGGVFEMYGQACFTNRAKSFLVLGMGTALLRENARFFNPTKHGSLLISPNNDDSASPGATAHVIVKDSAEFSPSGRDGSMVIGLRAGTRAVLDMYSSAPTNKLGGAFMYVGCNAGYGELNLNGTGYMTIGAYSGLHIGADSLSSTNAGSFSSDTSRATVLTAAPTGVVNMASGTVYIGGNANHYWNYRYLVGLIVGNGSRIRPDLEDPFESRLYRGEFHLSGGIVTNSAHLVVGAGRATGLMVQTGGTVYDLCGTSTAMAVGVAGGHGEYALSNGTLTVVSSLHVGGATTNQLDRGWPDGGGYPSANNYPADRHDARGRFTVACADKSKPCTLTVKKTITVSSDGAGVFEVVGTGATISAKDMIVSNAVDAVEGGESAVKFVLDEEGVSLVKLSGKLTVSEGAKLYVDMRDFDGSVTKAKLFSFASREGSFADSNIIITGGLGCVEQNETDITFVRKRGFTVIFR